VLAGNLRHLRVFLAIAESGSVTRAAAVCSVSQPAATQTLAKLEAAAGMPLFQRTPHGLRASIAGDLLRRRVFRAFGRLDPALREIAPRLVATATRPQLVALVGVAETQNFTLAAARLMLAQPTVHRAIGQIEQAAGRPLFQRSSAGILPGRPCLALAQAARLAFAEFDQAAAELADLQGREAGAIVIGATPLARSHVLPRALLRFRETRPRTTIRVVDGPWDDLLAGLRRGEIDVIVGALRRPAPVGDIVQECLFDDTLALLAAAEDPLVVAGSATIAQLQERPWLVPRSGTPARAQFDALFAAAGLAGPSSLIETGSVILMREMVGNAGHLACISRAQAASEIARNLVAEIAFPGAQTPRPIGVTYRLGWAPTPAQGALLDAVRACAQDDVPDSRGLHGH
jgi:DNA-binding transcriptional LysR family regulator